MGSKYSTANLEKIKTFPLGERKNLVQVKDFVSVVEKGSSFKEFLESFCSIQHRTNAATNFLAVVHAIIQAKQEKRPILWAVGPHVIKYGLSPLLIHLMKKGYVSAVLFNGASAIHDVEIALIGATSEEMSGEIATGKFGMWRESGDFINEAAQRAGTEQCGFGEILGKKLHEEKTPYRDYSILATGYAHNIPVTVHVAVGTDIIHMHPSMDGRATGGASFHDFRILCAAMREISGGVHVNIASSVVLPEVFLKALTVANNLNGKGSTNFVTANFDHTSEYRPLMNVIRRPTEGVGQGYEIIGRIELLIPFLVRAILEEGT